MSAIDWGAGEYEITAAELLPVAEHAVSLAEIRPAQRVLDLATGTGNAALAAARRGAEVTGIDAAPRLIEVAQQRAAAEGLAASFQVADLQELPFGDGSFDVVLSVFGLIFAPDPDRAMAELVRVLAPGGRGLISVWVPAGPIDGMVGVFMRGLSQVTGPRPPRFPWSDASEVERLAARHGASVDWHDGRLLITADSPEGYLDRQDLHPMSASLRPLLQSAGLAESVRDQALSVLRAGNEEPGGFAVHSPYRVIEVHPGPSPTA